MFSVGVLRDQWRRMGSYATDKNEAIFVCVSVDQAVISNEQDVKKAYRKTRTQDPGGPWRTLEDPETNV